MEFKIVSKTLRVTVEADALEDLFDILIEEGVWFAKVKNLITGTRHTIRRGFRDSMSVGADY